MKKLILFFNLICLCAWAKKIDGEAISLYIENDTRDLGGPGSDNAYTNGIKISYVSAENEVPNWARSVTDRFSILQNALQKSKSNFGVSITQQIYTPNDIRRSDLIEDDRPYAAWLYLGFSAHFVNDSHSHSLEVDVGVIGPEAGGENIQNGFHKIIAKYPAEGWRHQLGTEPTLQMSYQQRLKFFQLKHSNKESYFDIIPFFGGGLGNVAVDAHAGGMVRLGLNLPEDFAPTRPSMAEGDNFVNPASEGFFKPSIYVFAAGRGVGVLRNIFLDGSTFRASHHVTKYPFIVESEFGVAGIYQNWSLAWRFVTRSPEFEQKSVVNSFASVSISYAF